MITINNDQFDTILKKAQDPNNFDIDDYVNSIIDFKDFKDISDNANNSTKGSLFLMVDIGYSTSDFKFKIIADNVNDRYKYKYITSIKCNRLVKIIDKIYATKVVNDDSFMIIKESIINDYISQLVKNRKIETKFILENSIDENNFIRNFNSKKISIDGFGIPTMVKILDEIISDSSDRVELSAYNVIDEILTYRKDNKFKFSDFDEVIRSLSNGITGNIEMLLKLLDSLDRLKANYLIDEAVDYYLNDPLKIKESIVSGKYYDEFASSNKIGLIIRNIVFASEYCNNQIYIDNMIEAVLMLESPELSKELFKSNLNLRSMNGFRIISSINKSY